MNVSGAVGDGGYYLHTYAPAVEHGPCERCGLRAAAIPHARPVSRYPLPLMILSAGAGAASVIGLVVLGVVVHRLGQERAARHAEFCGSISHQTFASTRELHAYEAQNTCTVGGTIPPAGGRPVGLPTQYVPVPVPGPTVSVTVAGSKGQDVPGPTSTTTVTGPTTRTTVTVPARTVVRTAEVTATVTATRTCLPLAVGCS